MKACELFWGCKAYRDSIEGLCRTKTGAAFLCHLPRGIPGVNLLLDWRELVGTVWKESGSKWNSKLVLRWLNEKRLRWTPGGFRRTGVRAGTFLFALPFHLWDRSHSLLPILAEPSAFPTGAALGSTQCSHCRVSTIPFSLPLTPLLYIFPSILGWHEGWAASTWNEGRSAPSSS